MNENRVKITEIKEYYTVKRKEKNAAGEMVDVVKNLYRFKEIRLVTGWARFGHFMLDRVFYTIIEGLFGLALGVFLGLTGNAGWFDREGDIIIKVFCYVILYPWYYILLEYSSQASLAKLVLGRVVVNEYGEKPTFGQIVGRNYARLVPFEAFSCFSDLGWHDSWSKTYVIRKQDLADLKTLAKLQEHLAEQPRETAV